jgi:hypothetical protein
VKIIDKIKTVSSLIPSKTKEEEKNVAPCDVPEDTLCDSEEPIEEQIEKEGESGISKYLSKVDWIKVAAMLAQNRYGQKFPLVVKLAESLAEQKPQNISELMGAVKVFDLADLLSQVTVLKKKVPTPLLKLALGIIIFTIKRCVKHHTED